MVHVIFPLFLLFLSPSRLFTVTSKGYFFDASSPDSVVVIQCGTIILFNPVSLEEAKSWHVGIHDEALRTIVEQVDASLERYQERQWKAYNQRSCLAIQVCL